MKKLSDEQRKQIQRAANDAGAEFAALVAQSTGNTGMVGYRRWYGDDRSRTRRTSAAAKKFKTISPQSVVGCLV